MKQPVTAVDFWMSAKEIAALFGVNLTTARRWKRGAICPPQAVLLVLSCDLGIFDPSWRGWRIHGGNIISPEGWTISRNDALIVPLMHGQIAALRYELAKAREELEALKAVPQIEDQPMPCALDIQVI